MILNLVAAPVPDGAIGIVGMMSLRATRRARI